MAEFELQLQPAKSLRKQEELSASKSRPSQAVVALDDDDEVDEQVAGGLAGFFKSDAFQRIAMTVQTLISIWAAIMAALLSLFVPQLCCPIVSCVTDVFYAQLICSWPLDFGFCALLTLARSRS
jgi:hypothetical protein